MFGSEANYLMSGSKVSLKATSLVFGSEVSGSKVKAVTSNHL
jgi:hypothetical protein